MKNIILQIITSIGLTSIGHAITIMGNSLDKTGGASLSFIWVERCSDNSFAISNDYQKSIEAGRLDGKMNPCALVEKGQFGYVKNIGTKFDVRVTHSPTSVAVELNNIGDGFQIVYSGSANESLVSQNTLALSAQKCLLLMKNDLANEMRIQLATLEVRCQSK